MVVLFTAIGKLGLKSGERIRASAGGCVFSALETAVSLKIQAYALKALSCQCFHLEQFVVHNLDMIPVFMWSAGTEVPTQLHAMSDSFGWQPVNCVTLTEMASGPSVNSL